eukprot:CAMPEP_0202959700 /NCGR_PEP_ID=MMETSP1396-20130829/3876_1 /ASSEMBLY_ACC=CAM_ASM_000872 /TAXON_ID= /ORGANISM="Pseudokeronopsis sp., Strain Brazil" /LENGTH=74 /DNA_ID=CAMNT_0049678401 /DNA_START=356 /DNA_END=580 /DNA_ORIENTATION=+
MRQVIPVEGVPFYKETLAIRRVLVEVKSEDTFIVQMTSSTPNITYGSSFEVDEIWTFTTIHDGDTTFCGFKTYF